MTERYVADEVANGVWKLDAKRLRTTGFIPTGRGTHGMLVWPQPGRYSLGRTGHMR